MFDAAELDLKDCFSWGGEVRVGVGRVRFRSKPHT